MLYGGNVLACIQLVDNVSIATSTNFIIHILIDPNDGSTYVESDDYSDFQKMVITINSLSEQMRRQLIAQKLEFEDMQLEFMDMRRIAKNAEDVSIYARQISEESLANSNNAITIATEAKELVEEFDSRIQYGIDTSEEAKRIAYEVKTIAEGTNDKLTIVEEKINDLEPKVEANTTNIANIQAEMEDIQPKIDAAKLEAIEVAHQELVEALTFQEFGFEEYEG